jgi:carbamoyltransferase
MKNLVSIFAGHDSNISFYNAEKDEYHTIEIERLVQKRYFRLHEDNSPEYQKDILIQCRDIAEREWGIKNDYEAFLVSSDGYIQTDPREIFNTERVITIASHHQTHAASALHLSPFDKALIVSYDGGGDDGHFNVYMGDKEKGIRLLENIPSDFGGGYLLCGAMVREVSESSRHMLALSGKLMGLCGYGKVIPEYVNAFKEFFFDRDYNKLAKVTGLPLKNVDTPWKDPLQMYVFEDKKGYDIAASAQAGFEYALFSVLDKYDPDIPLIMTGGCALNVLVNEKVKCLYNRPLYVPPNPHDGSLSLGHIFLYKKPTKQVDITYKGLPLVDRNKLSRLH